jgi:hypothetical protein
MLDNLKRAFPEVYLYDIIETHEQIFEAVHEYFKGIDELWFIESYLTSKTFAHICNGHFVYLNKNYDELLDAFIEEHKGKYKKMRKPTFNGFFFPWLGEVLMYLSWYIGKPCITIYKAVGIDWIFGVYRKYDGCSGEQITDIILSHYITL